MADILQEFDAKIKKICESGKRGLSVGMALVRERHRYQILLRDEESGTAPKTDGKTEIHDRAGIRGQWSNSAREDFYLLADRLNALASVFERAIECSLEQNTDGINHAIGNPEAIEDAAIMFFQGELHPGIFITAKGATPTIKCSMLNPAETVRHYLEIQDESIIRKLQKPMILSISANL